ncbi:MAG: M24 family metallopeptidase [Veillonella sp.]|nr:M24 family metallopeptidase [Veillonella sp.]
MIILKSPHEIECIRKASKLTADTLSLLVKKAKPGITTLELDTIAEEYIRSHGGIPSCKGYYVKVTEESLFKGIEQVKVGNRIGAIGHAVQTYCEKHGYGVVRDFVGHGLGREMHEDPQIPNYGSPDQGPLMKPGMVLCIEPMITLGTHRVRVLGDDWTAVTVDGKPAAHFEHTVVVTENGPEILTMREEPRLIK